MNPKGKQIGELDSYELNRDYDIVRMMDGSVWEVQTNMVGIIVSSEEVIPPLTLDSVGIRLSARIKE